MTRDFTGNVLARTRKRVGWTLWYLVPYWRFRERFVWPVFIRRWP